MNPHPLTHRNRHGETRTTASRRVPLRAPRSATRAGNADRSSGRSGKSSDASEGAPRMPGGGAICLTSGTPTLRCPPSSRCREGMARKLSSIAWRPNAVIEAAAQPRLSTRRSWADVVGRRPTCTLRTASAAEHGNESIRHCSRFLNALVQKAASRVPRGDRMLTLDFRVSSIFPRSTNSTVTQAIRIASSRSHRVSIDRDIATPLRSLTDHSIYGRWATCGEFGEASRHSRVLLKRNGTRTPFGQFHGHMPLFRFDRG